MTRSATIPKARFKGGVKDLSGAYFDCANNHCSDTYGVLMKFIAGYIARECTHGVDIYHVVINMDIPNLVVSVDPTKKSDMAKSIYKEKVSHYIKR